MLVDRCKQEFYPVILFTNYLIILTLYSLVSLATAKEETVGGVASGIAKMPTVKLMGLLHGLQVVLAEKRKSGDQIALQSASFFFPNNFGYCSVCVPIQIIIWHGYKFYIVKVIAVA